jgi:two-component system sensor histidine kinase RegB
MHLHRLLIVRLVLLAVLCAVALLAPGAFGLNFARAPLLMLLGLMLALTLAGYVRGRAAVTELEMFAHLLADTLALSAAMYFTGGYMNPLISLLLLPLVTAAVTLRARYAWALAAMTVLAYTVLMERYQPLELSGGATTMFSLHLAGMWITFVLSALIVAFFVQRMSASVRVRDLALAQAREQMLRQQQVAALGALAAGAAHELGTPLATMAVIARELELELSQKHSRLRTASSGIDDVRTLQQQIAACKGIVARLQNRAGAQNGASQPFDAYVQELVEHWRLIRPAASCCIDLRSATPAPYLTPDAALGQAIVNLLNNAADASSEPIVLEASWTAQAIAIAVKDRGPGVARELLPKLGREPVTTKALGHAGLGLVLARTTADHFGGELSLRNAPSGGLIAQLSVPLAALQGAR